MQAASASERINLRTTPEAKHVIEQAAGLMGVSVSNFMVQQAYERAMSILEQHQSVVVGSADRDRILAALSNPQPANSALKDLLKLSD
jgi:uncharacterized protein (DUF1778 family)